MVELYESWRYGLMVLFLGLLSISLLLLVSVHLWQQGLPLLAKALSSWMRASLVSKIVVPICLVVSIVVGGEKPEGRDQAQSRMSTQSNYVEEVDQLSGYEPVAWGALEDENVFVRPDGAQTPSRWQGLGVSDDYQLVGGGLVAGVSGVAMRSGFGIADSELSMETCDTYAPYPGTLALIPGISDFWSVTNDYSTRLVWVNAAVDRNPANLVSFAVQLYDWGDVAFAYQDELDASGIVTPYIQVGKERVVLSETNDYSQVAYFKRETWPSPSWYVSEFPDFCEIGSDGELVWRYDTNEYYKVDLELAFEGANSDLTRSRSTSITLNQGCAIVRLLADNSIVWTIKFNEKEGRLSLPILEPGILYTVKIIGGPKGAKIDDISVPEGVHKQDLPSGEWHIWRPINLRISTDDIPATSAKRCRAYLKPSVKGGSYNWSASGPFSVATPGAQTTEVFRNGPGAGTLTCVWRRGLLAVTNSIALAETDMTQGGDYFGLSLDTPVILKEDAHLNVNGNAVPSSSPASRLDLTYSGSTAGEIEISSNNSNVRLRDGFVLRELPLQINVSEPLHRQWEVDLSQVPENVHEIEFTSRFTPANGDGSFDCQTTLRMAKLTLEADAPWPGNQYRHVFGPCETATARIEPTTFSTIWHDGARQTNGSQFDIPAPNAAVDKSISIEIEGSSISVPIRYIAPSGCAASSARAMTSADWIALNMPEPDVGKVGGGLYTNVRLLPDYVSFTNVWIREGYSPALGREGYFTHIPVSPHNDANGAGAALQIKSENGFIDRAGHSNNSVTITPAPGSFRFEIPMSWSVDNVSYMQFCVNVQAYESFASGALRVSKFGCSCQRELDGGTTVTQPGGQ